MYSTPWEVALDILRAALCTAVGAEQIGMHLTDMTEEETHRVALQYVIVMPDLKA